MNDPSGQYNKLFKDKTLEITNLNKDSLKSVAYIAHLGKKALVGGQAKEANLESEGSITLSLGFLFGLIQPNLLSYPTRLRRALVCGHLTPTED